MLYEVNNSNMDRFIEIINTNINENTENDYKMILFCDRTPKPLVKVLICTNREWRTFYQFCISSEYIKSNIDVISETNISSFVYEKLKSILILREEYQNEEIRIMDFYSNFNDNFRL